MTFAEAAMIMMSGGGSSYDDRISKINNADTIVDFQLSDVWSIRFKIVNDILLENYNFTQHPQTKEYVVSSYSRYPALYMCAYANDKFKIACREDFSIEIQDQYDIKSVDGIDVFYLYYKKDFGIMADPDNQDTFIPNKIEVSSVSLGSGNYPSLNIKYTYKQRMRIYDVYGALTETRIFDSSSKTFSRNMLLNVTISDNPNQITDTLRDLYNAYQLYDGG